MTGLNENRVDLHWSAEYSRNKISKEIYVTYHPLHIMSSETSLTQGWEGERVIYDLLKSLGYETKNWGTEEGLDIIGVFKKKSLCPPDNLPINEDIFFSITTERGHSTKKIKDAIKKKEDNNFKNAVCILKNNLLSKSDYIKYNKNGLRIWDNLKINHYKDKNTEISALKFGYGAVNEIRLSPSCSMIYGIPRYNKTKQSFYTTSIIFHQDSFGELKYKDMIELINKIKNYFIELHEDYNVKLNVDFHIKYIYTPERELTQRINDYFKENNMNYKLLNTTDGEITSHLLGDYNGQRKF